MSEKQQDVQIAHKVRARNREFIKSMRQGTLYEDFARQVIDMIADRGLTEEQAILCGAVALMELLSNKSILNSEDFLEGVGMAGSLIKDLVKLYGVEKSAVEVAMDKGLLRISGNSKYEGMLLGITAGFLAELVRALDRLGTSVGEA